MLQQTQVVRVEGFFRVWKKSFPNWKKLHQAEFGNVLTHWQGLGYNRRAKYLHQIADIVTNQYKGKFPVDSAQILGLPGIGPYTAGAIGAFCFNRPEILIETNIRTVLIHHFLQDKKEVSEKEIENILQACLKPGTKAHKNPREWYWALMDYGSFLKQSIGNLNKQSKAYNKQSRFEGSTRQLRSQILRYVLAHDGVTTAQVAKASIHRKKDEIKSVLESLNTEGMINVKKGKWQVS